MVLSRLAVTIAGLLNAAVLISADRAQSLSHSKILTRAEDVQEQYDYIVVGGGTAGLTVADRLTEKGKYSVLVIEFGVFQNSSSVTTVSYGFLAFIDPTLNFNITSVPQTGLNGRTVDVVVGKMLGGSSGHNGLQVHRGQKDDYDRWGSYFGRRSQWSWDGLLPYFKKAWHFHPPSPELASANNIKYDASYWGTSSNIHASFPTFAFPFLKTEIAAFGEIPGVQFPPDSGAGLPGAFWYPTSADPGPVLRSFSRTGHWDGIAQTRSNYHTVTGQKVLKVLFKNKKATGVTFVPADATSAKNARSVKAKKEVILAAGTIHTPQILQASGVGPAKLLKDAKIDVVVDLPGVGTNFQDHPFQVGALFNLTRFTAAPDPDDIFFNQTFIAEAQAEFNANRTGPLSIASGSAASFLPFKVIAPTAFSQIADKYEGQDPAAYLPPGTDKTVVDGYAAQIRAHARALRGTGSAVYNLFVRGAYNEGSAVYLHPLSRGTIKINPADPYFTDPIIDYRALSNPADADILVEFTRFTRRYFLNTSLSNYGPVELWPGANVTSSADIITALRSFMIPSTFHPVGTAPMMPRKLGGVVDEDLLVYGVSGLSVVDASIMPDLPGAYTQQTVYAIAEKAADLIKARA
ncbi:GMC oxidoreductase-like protein [Cladorrhinum sp. PSN259]|nr:GMC oxidoreductase-like protein [Cladorrhinum sp. PSN259]